MALLSIAVPSGLTPILSLIFGVIVLIFPKILNYAIGIYLILVGIIGILGII
ncbi:DUF3096 domain-containing protein [Candidatus Woesearchaeota archaeon]|nr:DUF3096 domain-containing protein [Candidatus Woesearchaeota archaeon]